MDIINAPPVKIQKIWLAACQNVGRSHFSFFFFVYSFLVSYLRFFHFFVFKIISNRKRATKMERERECACLGKRRRASEQNDEENKCKKTENIHISMVCDF